MERITIEPGSPRTVRGPFVCMEGYGVVPDDSLATGTWVLTNPDDPKLKATLREFLHSTATRLLVAMEPLELILAEATDLLFRDVLKGNNP